MSDIFNHLEASERWAAYHQAEIDKLTAQLAVEATNKPSDEVREAIRDALRQRKFDIYDGCGTDTEKAEQLCARYDKAFAWIDAQGAR